MKTKSDPTGGAFSSWGTYTLPNAGNHAHEEKSSSVFTVTLEYFCTTFELIKNHPVNTYPKDRASCQCPLMFPRSHLFMLLDNLVLTFI